MTEFETHVAAQLRRLRGELDLAVASDDLDQVNSLTFEIEDLLRLQRDNA